MGCNPDQHWLPWLRLKLEMKGVKVITPLMPETNYPRIERWVPALADLVETSDEQTFLVGHSIGCQTILRFIEGLPENQKVGGCVLVAPWVNLNPASFQGPEDQEIAKPWLLTLINWEKIKTHTNKFVCIFSEDDPDVPISDSEIFKEKLNAKIVTENYRGHFTQDEGVTELPSALTELENMLH